MCETAPKYCRGFRRLSQNITRTASITSSAWAVCSCPSGTGHARGNMPSDLPCPVCGSATQFIFEDNEETLPRICINCKTLVWKNDDGSVEYRKGEMVVQ